MSSGLEYMRPVTVTSVGAGGIVDENGRFLRMIGNLPVKPGDKVWTDGRIAYGHSPVRQNVNLPNRILGVPYFFNETVRYMILTPKGDELNKKNLRVGRMLNWMFSDKNAVYSGTANSPGLKDFLDIKVTNNAVYTAEYLPDDAPFYGETASGWGGTYRALIFAASNYYLRCDSNDKANPAFSLGWHYSDVPGHDIRLQSNPVICIKRNGSVVQQITLGDYSDFVMQTLQDVYLQYDEYDEDDTEKEIYYHCDARFDGKKYPDVDIFCSYTDIQCVNFSFTDGAGNWEMTLCAVGEGQVFPHTSDKERDYDEETGESKIIDVWSFFDIPVPVIYYVIRVDSRGKKSVLQRELIVKTLPQNGFVGDGENFHSSWENARGVEVEEVSESEKPAFWVNYGDYALKTDLINIQAVVNNDGTLLSNIRLRGSQTLTLSDAAEVTPWGAINKYVKINLTTGQITKVDSGGLGYNTGTKYGPTHYLAENIIFPAQYAPLYFGRVSFYKFADNDYMVVLRWQEAWRVKDGSIISYQNKGVPINVNQDVVNIRRAMKKPKTITDLIAYVTAGKLSGSQGG